MNLLACQFRIVPLASLALVAANVIGCKPPSADHQATTSLTVAAPPAESSIVKVFRVRQRPFREPIVARAIVQLIDETPVEAFATGSVRSVLVQPGDIVRRGDRLIELEVDHLIASNERAERSRQRALAAALAEVAQLEQKLSAVSQRLVALQFARSTANNSLVTTPEIETGKSQPVVDAQREAAELVEQLEESRQAVEVARAEIVDAKPTPTHRFLTAPRDAFVTRVQAAAGQVITNQDSAVLFLADPGKLRAVASLSREQAERVDAG